MIGIMAALATGSISGRAEPPAPDARVEQSAEAFALCDTKLSGSDELKAALRAEAAGPDRLIGDRLAMEHDQRAQIAVKRYTYGCRDANMRLLKEQFRSLQKEP
jgi:uncharacterized protein (DUF2342 family)